MWVVHQANKGRGSRKAKSATMRGPKSAVKQNRASQVAGTLQSIIMTKWQLLRAEAKYYFTLPISQLTSAHHFAIVISYRVYVYRVLLEYSIDLSLPLTLSDSQLTE